MAAGNEVIIRGQALTLDKFNDVFRAVKEYCRVNPSIATVCNFQEVADAAGVPLDGLGPYLAHLEALGLINHSMTDDPYLFLTSFGGRTGTVISGDW